MEGSKANPVALRYHPEYRRRGAVAPLHAVRLYELIGAELPQTEVERRLRAYVQGEDPPVVGALHLCCSDEAEYEVSGVFQRDFVRSLLPPLHFDERAPFRTVTLGARYEWGSARVAEDHFAAARGAEDWKLLVLKLNAHVAVDELPGRPPFGWLSRFGKESACCGALHAFLAGQRVPFAQELAETFAWEGVDRLGELRAAPEEERLLLAAICQARLQARRAMLDVQDYRPRTPTVTLIVPCVSFNRRHHDSELVVGLYVCDRRSAEGHDEYCGLGDRPSAYRVLREGAALRVEDPDFSRPRLARDHRRLASEHGRRLIEERPPRIDARLERALDEARGVGSAGHAVSRMALRGLLTAAAELSPVPAALALFGEGALAIHHSTRVHRLMREARCDPVARHMLEELSADLDRLDPERVQHLLDLLVEHYRPAG